MKGRKAFNSHTRLSREGVKVSHPRHLRWREREREWVKKVWTAIISEILLNIMSEGFESVAGALLRESALLIIQLGEKLKAWQKLFKTRQSLIISIKTNSLFFIGAWGYISKIMDSVFWYQWTENSVTIKISTHSDIAIKMWSCILFRFWTMMLQKWKINYGKID